MALDGLEDEVTKAGGGEAWAAKLFKKSVFDDAQAMAKLLDGGSAKAWGKLKKDPVYQLIQRFRAHYFEVVAPEYGRLRSEIELASGAYTKALRRAFPKTVFPVMPTARPFDLRQSGRQRPCRRDAVQSAEHGPGHLAEAHSGDPDFDMPAALWSC